MLDEAQSKRVVAAAGLKVSRDVVIAPGDARAIAALDLSFPVAVKVLSPDIPHKTEVGGVLLDIADHAALKRAIETVVANARKAKPAARIDGVLVSEMITDAVEAIVGVVNDEVFGPVVMLGMGGVLAEAVRDVAYRVAPIDLSEARMMIGELRSSSVFAGWRGRPPCDVEALAASLVAVSRLAWDGRERIAGLDINPMMVRPRGSGVVAADALVMLHETD